MTYWSNKRMARTARNAAYRSSWLDALVYPGGAHGFGVIFDRAGEWTIKVQKGNAPAGGNLGMRANALHTHPQGPFAAIEDAVTWIRETLYADRDDYDKAMGREKLSRYDIHLDWQEGWHASLLAGEERCFIKPARAGWDMVLSGDTRTGYTFGKRRIVARIYNKTREAANRNDDEYFALIAQQAGENYDPSLAPPQFCEQVEYPAAKAYAQQQHLLNLRHVADGTFATAGALKQHVPPVAEMGNLLAHIVVEPEEVAGDKGGAPQKLHDKGRRKYRVMPPRALFRLPYAA
jgi:hypothetical protein